MLASVADLPGIFDEIVTQGAQVVAIRALNSDGLESKPPAQLANTAGPGQVINSEGFAWIANHQASGKAWLQVQVQALRPPYDLQVSAFIEPDAVASYLATGQPKGTRVVAVVPPAPPKVALTGTSTYNEVTHTTVAK